MRTVAVLGVTLLALALATTASADHVSATFTVTAKVGERVGNSWRVEVDWAITCQGTSDALYFGTLALEEESTGESFFLGGTVVQSGKATASVQMKTTPRLLKPRMRSSCADARTLHGSDMTETYGNEVVVPALSCDPNLLAKALREYEVAKSFYNAAAQDLRNAHEEAGTTLAEKAKAKAKKKVLKKALTELIALLGEDAAAAASVTAFWVKIGVLVQNILLKVLPSLRRTQKAFAEAQKDFERGEAWRKRAEADLAAALAQGPCTGELRSKLDKALDEQRRQRAARELIESWENNGYLYISPATGEVLDEAAALREARHALAGSGRSTQSLGATTERRITATRRQIQAAVAKLTRSEAIDDRARARVQRADAAAERLRAGLRPLIR